MLSRTIAIGLPTFSSVIFDQTFAPLVFIVIFTSTLLVAWSKSWPASLMASPSSLAFSLPYVLIAYNGMRSDFLLVLSLTFGIPYSQTTSDGNRDLKAGFSRYVRT